MTLLQSTHTILRRLPPLAPPSILSWTLRHSSSSSSSPYATRPGPPRLSNAEQKEFEELLRRVNAPASKPADGAPVDPDADEVDAFSAQAIGDGDHPDYRRKPMPKWEGSTNPETGEVGGPKFEPLEHGDWAYGGKVTDF